ncbi:MAG TPA: hypothetical protein VK832_11790 [Burkholderiaceae bacterium]|jgi:hypothetical protein|nr:hypothetical protein [Burkholderiaceae bacterium]
MRPSKRIALPLAIALHLLALYALDRWSKAPHSLHTVPREGLTIQLIPFIPLKSRALETPRLPQKETAQASRPQQRLAPESVAPQKNIAEPTSVPEVTGLMPHTDLKLQLNDAAALVKAYSYEDSKSDLQKAIEAHGGTVALVEKGKVQKLRDGLEFATIPDCLSPDALKHNPPQIGPISLGGILILPFLADAALTGKCK